MVTTTHRNDIVTGLKAMLDAFAAANPTYLNGTFRSRPASMGDRPLAFIGPRNETINNEGVIFQRDIPGQVVFVWAPSADQRELADVRDDIVDAFVGYARERPHAISNQTACGPARVEDVELELDGAFYPASIVSFVIWHQQAST